MGFIWGLFFSVQNQVGNRLVFDYILNADCCTLAKTNQRDKWQKNDCLDSRRVSFSAINREFQKNLNFFEKTLDFIGIIVYNIQALSGCSADGSVLGSGPRGRGFKSRHSDQIKKSRIGGSFSIFDYILSEILTREDLSVKKTVLRTVFSEERRDGYCVAWRRSASHQYARRSRSKRQVLSLRPPETVDK